MTRREGTTVYQWFVFTHLIGLVIFVFAHGVSAFVSWQVRTLRDPNIIAGYLTMSQQAVRVAYIGLLVLLLGGAAAATDAALWSKPWVWGSVIVLVLMFVGMYGLATSYYAPLRQLLAGKDGQPPIGPEALAAYLDSRRPDMISGVGALGLLILVWLMVLKPG